LTLDSYELLDRTLLVERHQEHNLPSSKPSKAAARRPTTKKKVVKKPAKISNQIDVDAVVDKLKSLASEKVRDGMARYAIPSDNAFGVAVGVMRKLGKELGPNHELALALWDTGWYEARMLATFVDEPERVTSAQMDGWCRDFDSWAICDTACFHLFDRTPHAFAKVEQWAKSREEFVKRGAFALLACLALHDKRGPDEPFRRCLPLIVKAASDERNFVKKGVSWALRGIGHRPSMKAEAIELANRLTAAPEPSARWIGRDALRDLTRKR
jgi:3-methyladenine DNA glycosylase AlkD